MNYSKLTDRAGTGIYKRRTIRRREILEWDLALGEADESFAVKLDMETARRYGSYQPNGWMQLVAVGYSWMHLGHRMIDMLDALRLTASGSMRRRLSISLRELQTNRSFRRGDHS